jgi:hypothetical protein
MSFGRKKKQELQQADPLHRAITLMAPFARTHQGVFILDGPAIGTSPAHSTVNALDVYCLFSDESMTRSASVALNALRPLTSDIGVRRGTDMSSYLSDLCERALIVGDRRQKER